MIDAHCHVRKNADRHFICGGEKEGSDVVFYGTHPWYVDEFDKEKLILNLMQDKNAGVGEIGLDRLKSREISPLMREVFNAQLEIAANFSRRVVLHGAKCWGEVVKACMPYSGKIPAFIFHGFSRSGGLIPDIAKLNGFISVGPAVLNHHAVNYRNLVKAIPEGRLLIETDCVAENFSDVPPILSIAEEVARLRSMSTESLIKLTDDNALRFLGEGE